MRAAILWTISDFPAYAMLSGWSTKGKLACPICHINTDSRCLKYCRKECYLGHRRWLDMNHAWRKNSRNFNGQRETRCALASLSGEDIALDLSDLPHISYDKKRKHGCAFIQPYWSKLLIRHNIDVMHTEQNVSEALHGTMMDTEHKTKDGYNTRMDLKEMRIRLELQPFVVGEWVEIPPAKY